MDGSLKPYIVLVSGDTDYLVAAREFLEENLRGFTIFLASSSVEAISTMHHLNGPAIFLVEYDLPDMDGFLLITQNIRKTFLFDAYCSIVTDNATQEVEEKCAAADIGYFPKSRQHDDSTSTRRIYNLDIFYRGIIKRGISELGRAKAARTKDVFAGIHWKEDGIPPRWSRDYKRARMYRTPISAIYADVNDLKFVNDTYGHDKGDVLIESFVQALHTHIRERDKFDYILRWGGDEFVIILPETRLESARGVRARIANHLKPLAVEVAPGIKVQLSVAMGVATLSARMLMTLREEESFTELLKAAEVTMYRKKRSMKASVAKSSETKPEVKSQGDPQQLLLPTSLSRKEERKTSQSETL